MKKLLFLVVACATLIFVSCSKNVDATPAPPPSTAKVTVRQAIITDAGVRPSNGKLVAVFLTNHTTSLVVTGITGSFIDIDENGGQRATKINEKFGKNFEINPKTEKEYERYWAKDGIMNITVVE